MNSKNNSNGKSFVVFISYVALAGVGIALLLDAIGLFGGISATILKIVHAVTYITIAMNAFYFIKGKTTAYHVVYWVSLVLIVISYVIPILKTLM